MVSAHCLHFVLWLLTPAAAFDICAQTGQTKIVTVDPGSLEAHIDQSDPASSPQTCEAVVQVPLPVSRIKIVAVMFSLGDDCSRQSQDRCPNFLRINDRKVCTCRSADEMWEPLYIVNLAVHFRRSSSSAAGFRIDYEVQRCRLADLVGSRQSAEALLYDSAQVTCIEGAFVTDAGNKVTDTTIVRCHLENGTWDHKPLCALGQGEGMVGLAHESADDAVNASLPPSQEILSHLSHSYHEDDDDFPKELVGGLSFVLVILIVVVIGATIYTIKRRYKVIVIRRPSRGASLQGRGANAMSLRATPSAPEKDEESALAAEERLLPPPQPPGASGDQRNADNEYATPFAPALGSWSPPAFATGGQPSASQEEPPRYFVLEKSQTS